ncbi:MAG TPA: cysteine rich repeat-containing protein [Thermodesulfovibrionales bacterium]|nr:cysteine rich repeat-containing protein [Thermodesulfovibrionales bacterium]
MKGVLIVFVVCMVTLMIVSGAFAQEVKPCAGDVVKFCGNVSPGEGRIAGCLKQNEAQLSPACKVHLMQVKEALKEVDKACEDDIAMYCGGVKPGSGQIMECLKANKSHLSRRCKIKLFEAKGEMK